MNVSFDISKRYGAAAKVDVATPFLAKMQHSDSPVCVISSVSTKRLPTKICAEFAVASCRR